MPKVLELDSLQEDIVIIVDLVQYLEPVLVGFLEQKLLLKYGLSTNFTIIKYISKINKFNKYIKLYIENI